MQKRRRVPRFPLTVAVRLSMEEGDALREIAEVEDRTLGAVMRRGVKWVIETGPEAVMQRDQDMSQAEGISNGS